MDIRFKKDLNLLEQGDSVRKISVKLLQKICANGGHSHEILPAFLNRLTLSQQDKSLITELVNGTLRWSGQLDWILSQFFRGDFKKSPVALRRILELSLYQLRFLDKIPAFAAVSEGVDLAKESGGEPWARLVNGLLRNYLRNADSVEFPAIRENPVQALSVRYSHPKWLVKRWLARYGLEETRRFCEYNNQRPNISLRVNLKEISREDLILELKKSSVRVQPSDYFADFVRVQKLGNLSQLPAYKEGKFAIQDESTALASLLLAPEKGDTVLDMCAAPGGKTCHLAQLVGGDGKVIAIDNRRNRLNLLRENVSRLKLACVYGVVADSTTLEVAPVDKVLLDAPCSGLGVLAKRADLRWKRRERDIHTIRATQKRLLENGARLLKAGGTLVYSTCTLEPEETQDLILEFLHENQHFQIDCTDIAALQPFSTKEGFWASFPSKHRLDGVFAARLIKKIKNN
ncbi:MAG: 16S rRNA (cytosine(967)-C(5))-methyltransferase RsmB [bacterium]